MSRPKVRSARLGHRPMSARRAVGGPVRLVIVADVRERAAMFAATLAGVVALVLAVIGGVVLAWPS